MVTHSLPSEAWKAHVKDCMNTWYAYQESLITKPTSYRDKTAMRKYTKALSDLSCLAGALEDSMLGTYGTVDRDTVKTKKARKALIKRRRKLTVPLLSQRLSSSHAAVCRHNRLIFAETACPDFSDEHMNIIEEDHYARCPKVIADYFK